MKVFAKCVCGKESTDAKEIYENFETHEVSPGVHKTFCKLCVETLELDYGK